MPFLDGHAYSQPSCGHRCNYNVNKHTQST